MDIEGWEAKAIAGMEKTLQAYRPTILFEFAPERIRAAGDSPKEMLKHLVGLGYELESLPEGTFAGGKFDDIDAFMSHFKHAGDYQNIVALPHA